MARVNVEQIAFTDARFRELGRLVAPKLPRHLAHALAIGLMASVWNFCQERNTYALSARDLANITDVEGFGKHLVTAKLGKKEGRLIYICGLRGRIEWLEEARFNGKKGGRPKGSKSKNQTVRESKPSGSSDKNPLAVAVALTLTPSLTGENHLPPESGGSSGGGTDKTANLNLDNFNPSWTERQFQFKSDKITEWVQKRAQANVVPGTEDFDTEFEAAFGMGYERWLYLRPRHEAFFSRETQ